MALTKLDSYDYVVLPGVIQVRLTGTNDPILVDILSEIDRSDGKIYVEGHYYLYLNNYKVFTQGDVPFLELEVVNSRL